jgi:hypothetical protein
MPDALDLGRETPRSPFADLGGYPWLPRLIDKVRAHQAGKLGAYTPFPSGIDEGFIGLLGVAPEALRLVIKQGASDDDILAWVQTNQVSQAPEGVRAFRLALTRPVPAAYAAELAEEVADRSQAFPHLDFSQAVNFVHVICLEEGHPWPGDKTYRPEFAKN